MLDKGTDIKYGARPLRRAIQRYLEDELSDMILRSELQNGDTISVSLEEDHLKFNVENRRYFYGKTYTQYINSSKIFLIPFIIYFIVKEQYITALILLTVSGLTDILDGWIARKFNFITNFGKLIDPLADKATQLAVLLTITFKGVIPFGLLL